MILPHHSSRLFVAPFLIGVTMCLGCDGSSSGSTFETGFVTDVRVDPEAVRVGQQIGIQVDFNPSQINSTDIDGDTSETQTETTVVLRLPSGVDYVSGSSEFDGSDVRGFRERGPNRVDLCGDGTRVLSYFFSGGELTDNENKIRLAARAFQAVGVVSFEAEADDSINTPCGILAQDLDTLTINP